MRKMMMSGIGAAVVAALTAAPAFAGHTLAEIHVFFGAAEPVSSEVGGFAAPSFTTNPTVGLTIGGPAMALPIWAETLVGDVSGTQWGAIGFKVYQEGLGSVVNSGNGSVDLFSAQGAHAFTPAAPGVGANTLFPSLAALRGGYFNQYDGTARLATPGVYFLGYMEVTGTVAGSTNLFISDGAILGQSFGATTTTIASRQNIAFGAVGGAPDAINRANTLADLTQTSPFDSVSFTADATITVVPIPEPATLGLLGVGLAGLIRRRRQA